MRAWITVPCYNESSRLDVAAFEAYLAGGDEVGFIFVNDGSSDDTLDVLQGLAARWPGRVEAIDQQPNQGKAQAVRVGMLRAMDLGAPYAGYFDADLATPLDELERFTRTLDRAPEIDIVLGARVALLGHRIERKASRHYLGRVFATAASLVLGLPVYDTQCGAKMFRVKPSTRALFARSFGSRWIFDVELLARHTQGGGTAEQIFELPLRTWTDVGESKVKPIDFVRAIAEMGDIYRTYRASRGVRDWLTLITAPFIRYVGAGGVGTLLHYATLAAVVELSQVPPAIATMIGATVGALTNYLLNYHLTFASKATHRRTLPRFMAVAVLATALSGFAMWILTEHLGIHYLLSQLACTALVLVVGYVLNRTWTFAPPPRTSLAPAPSDEAAKAPAPDPSARRDVS